MYIKRITYYIFLIETKHETDANKTYKKKCCYLDINIYISEHGEYNHIVSIFNLARWLWPQRKDKSGKQILLFFRPELISNMFPLPSPKGVMRIPLLAIFRLHSYNKINVNTEVAFYFQLSIHSK